MPPRWIYDAFYRVGAPWDIGPRRELVDLVATGWISPSRLPPGRAVDLGCGTGANALHLAAAGFEVTGVDFSRVALAKAAAAARSLGAGFDRVRWVHGNLTAEAIPGADGPFDLLVDCCVIDDMRPARRPAAARTMARLARPGAQLFLWCFYDNRPGLPPVSLRGPSRLNPEGLARGEEETLFGDAFRIRRLPHPPAGSGAAAFLMTRR